MPNHKKLSAAVAYACIAGVMLLLLAASALFRVVVVWSESSMDGESFKISLVACGGGTVRYAVTSRTDSTFTSDHATRHDVTERSVRWEPGLARGWALFIPTTDWFVQVPSPGAASAYRGVSAPAWMILAPVGLLAGLVVRKTTLRRRRGFPVERSAVEPSRPEAVEAR